MYLRRDVHLRMQIVQESPLRRERSHGDDSLQDFSEVREDRTATIGLHATQVSSRAQISNSEMSINETDDHSGEDEKRENNAAMTSVERVQ